MYRIPFSIDDTDLSDAVAKYAYTVGYEPRIGENSGTMQDGTEREDVLGWKAVLTVACNDLPENRVVEILQKLTNKTTVSVTYLGLTNYFPTRTAEFHVRLAPVTPTLYNQYGRVWWRGLTLTLREV